MRRITIVMKKLSKVEKADIRVARATAPVRHTAGVRFLGALSEIADQPPLISLTAATLAAGLLTGNRSLARAGGRMLAAELLATWLKGLVKHRIDRTRPRLLFDEGRYGLEPGGDRDSGVSSFPSGHTAGAVAVARALGRDYPAARLPALSVAALIGAVQVPRAQHYLSDLAAGAAVGLAAEAIVTAGGRALARGARAIT